MKELVVQWPRAGSSKREGVCVSVARLTIVDHQGVLTTLAVELHPSGSEPTFVDYVVHEEEPNPRAVFTLRPLADRPEILVSLSGPAGAARDSLERTLEFLSTIELAQRFGAL